MAKWDYTAVHGLNKYLWSRLQSELGWSASDYNGLTPIATPQQQPEFNAIDKPYIVYGYTLQGSGTDWFLNEEVITYTIFATQSKDIREAVNLFKAVLNRFDESATDVNDYVIANGSGDNKAFDYKTIRVNMATGPEPAVTEGGRQDGSVIVSVTYTHYNADGDTIRF